MSVLRLLGNLVAGGDARQRALARLRARRLRGRVRRVRRDHPGEAVVVAMLEHMGDVVSVEPAIRLVRRRHPTAHLTFAVKPIWRDLVAAHPEVDHVLDVASLGDWMYLVPRELYDAVYDLQTRGRWCSRTNLLLDRPDAPADLTIDTYYDRGPLLAAALASGGLGTLADADVDLQPRLYPTAAARAAVDALGLSDRFAVLHTRSNQASRDWNDAGWAALVKHLRDAHNLPSLVIGVARPGDRLPPGAVDFRGKLAVAATGELIRRATLFAGIDSGPAHLANAAGAPGVVVLGVYRSFARYVPYTGGYATGATGTLLHHAAAASETPADVVRAAVDARLRHAAGGNAVAA